MKLLFYRLKWNCYFTGEKAGYAGVALYSKEKPINVEYGIGNKEYDKEGRVITAEYEKFFLIATCKFVFFFTC